MNILEITFVPPALNKGGGHLGIYQSIKSLQSFANVDYIGPEFDVSIFDKGFGSTFILKQDSNFIRRAFNLCKGITTSYFHDFFQILNRIDWSRYDAVHIDTSRYYFLVKIANGKGIPTAIRFHNIERDYAFSVYRSKKSIINYLKTVFFSQNEKKVLDSADLLIFITKEDKERAQMLYNYNQNNWIINPVSIEGRKGMSVHRERSANHIEFLMTGTLNHGPNMEGILWFGNNVWKQLKRENIFLTIAGFRPGMDIIELANKDKRIRVIDSPDDMTPYFDDADLYVAPIFDGAGMKVKVAEALSEGLPVIGTPHAWLGYDGILRGKFIASSANEFLDIIDKLLSNIEEIRTLSGDIRDDFMRHLSMEHSSRVYEMAFEKLINDNKKGKDSK